LAQGSDVDTLYPKDGGSAEEQEAEETLQGSQDALTMLAKLQTLPWCRMDCSFKGTKFPYFAHNLVQVTPFMRHTETGGMGERWLAT
jgi:hypothetical protein